MTTEDIVAIQLRIIHLGNENDIGILCLDLRNNPFPKLHGYHFCHVTTEAVYSLCRPIEQDVEHLLVGIGAIVQLDSFIPVVSSWPCREYIIACGLCGILCVKTDITTFLFAQDIVQMQRFSQVIEVVFWRIRQ